MLANKPVVPDYELICPECKNPNGDIREDHSSGDMVCRECGLVIGERLVDPRAEKRTFADSDSDPSRTSKVNEFLRSNGLATEIATGGKMSQYQRRIQVEKEDQALLAGFEKITHISEILKLPQRIRIKAKELYSQFEAKRNKTMRAKRDSIVAAIIYMACKEESVPRTFKEISRETDIPFKEIRKYYLALTKLLPKGEGRTSAANLVHRFGNGLKLPFEVCSTAATVAEKGSPLLEGRDPSSIAAACLLFACKLHNQPRPERDIAVAASISPTTLKNAFKILMDNQAKVLPENHHPLQ
ncbi:transcription initiation factor IIB [Balamuthia mandrillaris]